MSDDELIDFNSTKSPQPPLISININNKRNSLPPVSEFNDDDDIDYDEKQILSPIIVENNSFDDEKEKLFSYIKQKKRDRTNSNCSNIMSFPYDEHNIYYDRASIATFSSKTTHSVNIGIEHNEEDDVDKLLQKVSGSSYHKFRKYPNEVNVKMDTETKQKLKAEIIKHIDKIKKQYVEQKNNEIKKYKQEAKQWED